MVDALQLHLKAFGELSLQDRALLDRLTRKHVREIAARRDLIREGEKPRAANVVLEGWACRYKQLPDGRRQIVAFLLPGDLFDANSFILKQMDHSIGAITRVRHAEIMPSDFEELMAQSPGIARAFMWHELVKAAVQREWTTNVGQRTALERIAHLFCELFFNLQQVGLTDGSSCDFPLTQIDIADATALTAVHVNRTLQELRREGLIELTNKRLTIPDLRALMRVSMFNPNYLHLNHESGDIGAAE